MLAVATFSIGYRRQLDTIGGFTAPDAALGFNLAARGVIGIGDEPTIFKAPGHAVLVAAVTRLAVGRPTVIADERRHVPPTWTGLVPPFVPGELRRAANALYAVHAVFLALASAALLVWLSSFTSRGPALALSLAFGLSPFALVLVGLLHYALPHMCLLAVCTWLLQRALVPGAIRPGWRMALAGLGWGLSTTLRSVTLPMPAFVLLALVAGRRPVRETFRLTVAFALAFSLGVAPASIRATRLAGRFVPVNAQLWAALWNVTIREAPAMPNHFRWKLFRDDFLELQSATAGRELESSPDPFRVRENLRMEDIARAQTLQHLRRDPRPYLANVWHSFVSFNWDTSAVLVQLFQYVQSHPSEYPKWFPPGQPQAFHDKTLREAFTWLVRTLTVLAAVGLAIAIRKRDPTLLPVVAVYACLCAAHSLVFLDVLYYYVKLPFLYAGAAYALDRLGASPHAGVARLARAVTGGMAVATLVMTALMLGRP